jgi:hypothetical protein
MAVRARRVGWFEIFSGGREFTQGTNRLMISVISVIVIELPGGLLFPVKK